jgi:hypothetical protein
MRKLIALGFVLAAACGGPTKKTDTAIVDEGSGSATGDMCCCKATPATSEDGKPVFSMGNRMECSTRQGSCVTDEQCKINNPSGGATTP